MESDKKIIKTVKEIQKNYREGYKLKTNKAIFQHILKQISKHITKLNDLEGNKAMQYRLKREIADMYLLSLGLVDLEKVNNQIIKDSADYYLNKVKENIKTYR